MEKNDEKNSKQVILKFKNKNLGASHQFPKSTPTLYSVTLIILSVLLSQPKSIKFSS